MIRPHRVRSLLASAALVCGAGGSFAAHPLQTEDTGTQGAGNIEFEKGFSRQRSAGTTVLLYQPQLSYGVSTPFDLIVQPSWLRQRDTDDEGSAVRGFGDTNVDVKWRFQGAGARSFGVRAGVTLPTSEHGLGMTHGRLGVHAVAVSTVDLPPFSLHVNLGASRQPTDTAGQRSTIGHVSGALMWSVNERWTLALDVGAESNADAARRSWPATGLVGAIWTIRPGFDADLGYQSRVGSASSSPGLLLRQWLVGLTYRFAP